MKYLFLLLCFLCPISAKAQDAALAVAQKMDMADTGWKDEIVSSNMILRTSDGAEITRTLKNRIYEVAQDGDKSAVIFERPMDVKGTVFLNHSHKTGNDDQWLFMPALNRVKRITSSNRSGPFMGSEFAYEDLSSDEVERYTYELLDDVMCGEQLECYQLVRFPNSKNSGYSKQIVYLDQAHFRIHKIDYYDRKNSHLKTLTRSNYQRYGNFWRAEHWEMKNVQTGKSTIIDWYDRQVGTGLKDAHFSPSRIERFR